MHDDDSLTTFFRSLDLERLTNDQLVALQESALTLTAEIARQLRTNYHNDIEQIRIRDKEQTRRQSEALEASAKAVPAKASESKSSD